MHRAYTRAWLARLEVVERDPDPDPDSVLLDPHAVTASVLAAARLSLSNRGMRRLYSWRGHTDVTAGPEDPPVWGLS
jgi:hypothetical protein